MSEDYKLAAEHLYIFGTKTATTIIYALRNQEIIDRLPATINKDNLREPSLKQLENYLYNQLKPRLEIKSNFNYGELFQWVKDKSTIPDDPHQGFILDHFFEINKYIPAATTFRYTMSRKFLLEVQKLTNPICADTTHKAIWQGFPVFMTGTTDLERHFHPTI